MARALKLLRAAAPRTPSPVLSTQLRAETTGGFQIREHQVVARGENPRHSHDYHCIGFLIHGLGTAEFARESWTVRPGCLNVIPGGVAHRERFGTREIRWCGIEIPEVREEFRAEARRAFDRPFQLRGGAAGAIAARIYRELRVADDASRLSLHGLGLELLATLARESAGSEERERPSWIRRAEEYVRASFLDEISLHDLAAEIDVHPTHLARVFRRTFGVSLGQYVRGLRIEYAATLVADRSVPLAQIATQTGFADQAHFTRVFKRHHGIPPGAYRNRLRN